MHTVTVSPKFQVVIPRPVRESLGIEPGQKLQVSISLKVAAAAGDVPQNVNFAIKGAIVRTFLESNEIPYSARPSGATIETTVIAEQVKKAVAVVECWK